MGRLSVRESKSSALLCKLLWMRTSAAQSASPRMVSLRVCAVHPTFGNAYAEDVCGEMFMMNTGTVGVDFLSLKVGQQFVANVNSRNYVVSAEAGYTYELDCLTALDVEEEE